MKCLKTKFSQLAILLTVSSLSYGETIFLSDDIVKQYAPVVYLHSDEKFQPSSLEWFTDSPQISFDGARYNYNQSFDGNYHNPSNATVLYGQKPGASDTPPPYYAIVYPRGNNTTDVVYAMFYPYNQGKKGCEFLQGDYKFNGWEDLSGSTACKLASVANYNKSYGNHVGDWESVTVRFNGNTPIAAYLSAHGDRPKHNWNELEFDGQRPIVYSALGSHALYKNQGYHTSNITDMPTTVDVAMCAAFPKTYSSCKEVCIPVVGCHDVCSPPIPDVCTNVRMNLREPTNRGTQWKPSANDIQVIHWHGRVAGADSPLTRNYVDKESWLNFTGHYGNAAQGDEQGGESELNSGPTGPLDESLFNKISGGAKDLSFLTPNEKSQWVGLTTEVIAHIITQTLSD
ncbi:Vps62-related protein [Spartinivicinus poritis]|uniref:Vps62-related protein n=1 Tax=Spartinivicinus poritis TaxID=2994640 RepID=A0ABT5U917_9GAMM|nr:Vps62-related protein [Spartinivicinus sp. A2-2]MDE1462042.1 Vps62-related protein [Spartinivicinus sp. A2-2]